MELIIAAWLMIASSLGTTHPDVTMEQWLQSALSEQNAFASINEEGQIEFIKHDPQGQLGDAPVVKGMYATANTAGGARLASLLHLIDTTELNSLVIDVKDDWGYITYKTEVPELQ